MKIISPLFVAAGIIALLSVSLTPAYAGKKCKDGYVWDEETKKCVRDYRGSY